VPLAKAMPFITVVDHSPRLIDGKSLIKRFVQSHEQRELFEIAA
jgi:hypothetical protein